MATSMLSIDAIDALQERIRQAPNALIAARIRRARRESELRTLDNLAGAVGSSRQHMIKLEQAKHRPRAELLTRIADATDRSVDYFLDEEAVENPFPDEA